MNNHEKIYLHTGSNLGQKEQHLAMARQLIHEYIGPITAKSEIFETEAWGDSDQPNYVNQALEVTTNLSPDQLMDQILNIELKMGRIRNQKWESRLIDIDIIFYGNQVIKTENLIIPHPYMHKRNFVLMPLLEIAKDVIHPEFKLNVKELYKRSKDPLKVKANYIK